MIDKPFRIIVYKKRFRLKKYHHTKASDMTKVEYRMERDLSMVPDWDQESMIDKESGRSGLDNDFYSRQSAFYRAMFDFDGSNGFDTYSDDVEF